MTYKEIRSRLTKCETTLQAIKNGTYTNSPKEKVEATKAKLEILRESLKKKLNEAEGKTYLVTPKSGQTSAVSMSDKEVEALKDADDVDSIKGVDGQEIKEEVKFSKQETGAIAKVVGKALAKALKSLGDELAHMKALDIEESSFEIHVEYKKGTDDQFSFYISEDRLHLVDFSFDKELVDVGVKPSGEAVVNVDVLSNELVKHFKGNMNEMKPGSEEAMEHERFKRLSKKDQEAIEKIRALMAAEKAKNENDYIPGLDDGEGPRMSDDEMEGDVDIPMGEDALGFSDIEKLGSKAASDIDISVRRDPNYTFGKRPGDDDRLRYKYAKQLGYLEENEAEDTEGGDLDVGHKDDEPDMLKQYAYDIATYAAKLYKQLDKYDKMDGEVDFPNWWQSKVILAKDYISKAQHYLEFEEKQPAIDQLALEGTVKEEYNINPEAEKYVKRFIKGVADKYGYDEMDAVHLIYQTLANTGYLDMRLEGEEPTKADMAKEKGIASQHKSALDAQEKKKAIAKFIANMMKKGIVSKDKKILDKDAYRKEFDAYKKTLNEVRGTSYYINTYIQPAIDELVADGDIEEGEAVIELLEEIADNYGVKIQIGGFVGENKNQTLKEYTDNTFSGAELIDMVSKESPDMFGKKVIADLLPKGVASEDEAVKALHAHDKSGIKQRMGSQHAPMFVHVQYHELEHEGERYRLHQRQYYNSNFKDKDPDFNPAVTKITLVKVNDPDRFTKNTENLGSVLVKTDAYIQDIRDLESQGKLGQRYMEEGALNENADAIKFAQFIHAHGLTDKEIKDSEYLQDLYNNYIEDYQENIKEYNYKVIVNGKEVDIKSIEIAGVDRSQGYDDGTVDAYAEYATFVDGTELSDSELDDLTDNHSDLIHDLAIDSFHENVNEAKKCQCCGDTPCSCDSNCPDCGGKGLYEEKATYCGACGKTHKKSQSCPK